MQKSRDVRLVHVGRVIDWAISTYGDGTPQRTEGAFTRAELHKLRSVMETIGGVPDMLVGAIESEGPTRSLQHRYKALRRSKRNGEPLGDSAIRGDLEILMKAIKLFAAHHKMLGVPKMGFKKKPLRLVKSVSRKEIARVLIACRGYKWDHEQSDWLKDSNGRYERVALETSLRKALERIVIISVYSGSRGTCLCNLRWLPHLKDNISYVDFDTDIQGRTGFLVKLGKDRAQVRMADIPVKMSRRLTAHMRRWFEKDGSEKTHVIDRIMVTAAGKIQSAALSELFANAGLDESFDIIQLQDAATIWALRAGIRTPKGCLPFESKPSIVRSAALMRGAEYLTFSRKFGIFHKSFQREQVEALENLAETIR